MWSKTRRHDGPQGVTMLVAKLTEARAGAMLSLSAWRWGGEVPIKARKSGLPRGQRQVTQEAERVRRAVALSGVAALLLVRLNGHDEAQAKEWRLFKRTERLTEDVAQEHRPQSALRWQRTRKQLKEVA